MLPQVLRKLVAKESLTIYESEAIFSDMLHGLLTPAQIAAVLMGLATKGESADEIAGAATIMKGKVLKIEPNVHKIVDICGTGGDSLKSFNISTTVAFVLAGGGVSVAKHGNRSVSSASGSADVFEMLNIPLEISPKKAAETLETIGLVFLFAPNFHPALKHVMPIRNELKIRTIFNVLGPIVNPAGATRQLVGVYKKDLCEKVAHALQKVGVDHALVVNGDDGMDEITLTEKTHFAHVEKGKVTSGEINPEDYGFSLCEPGELGGGTPKENAELLLKILRNEEKGAKRDIVLLNAGAAFWISGEAKDIKEGVKLALRSLESRAAYKKLEELQEFLG